MYTCFGQSWAALHLGPMWSYVDVTPQEDSDESIVDILAVALEESGITHLRDEDSSLHEESQSGSTGILTPEDSYVASYVCESPTPTVDADLPINTTVPELQLQNISQQSSEEIQISSTPLSGQSLSFFLISSMNVHYMFKMFNYFYSIEGGSSFLAQHVPFMVNRSIIG